MADLSPRHEAIAALYVEGWDAAKIARILQLDEHAVRVLVSSPLFQVLAKRE